MIKHPFDTVLIHMLMNFMKETVEIIPDGVAGHRDSW